jgi:hypothetical protein
MSVLLVVVAQVVKYARKHEPPVSVKFVMKPSRVLFPDVDLAAGAELASSVYLETWKVTVRVEMEAPSFLRECWVRTRA